MNLWTNDDINRILLCLDEMELPFKKYTIKRRDEALSLIGRGGSANVYEAFTRSNGRPGYALKVIGFSGQNSDSVFFEQSVSAQKEIGDFQENVVNVYDHTEIWITFDANDNILSATKKKPMEQSKNTLKLQFVLMEKLPVIINRTKAGNIKTIPEALATGDEKEILKLAYDIGGALKRAHNKNILHRDVKLENIFYSEKKKQYKLGDFGIAKKTEDGFAGTVAFTKGYAAPEVRGTPENDCYDNTADIYSFGMMLYVLSNQLRFPDSNTYNVNSSVQYSKGYILPKPDNAKISEGFYLVMVKACMYDPDQRYQSMDEMLVDIEKLMYSESLGYKKEHKGVSLVVGSLLLAIGIAAWKITMAPNTIVSFSLLEYIFLLLGLGKGIQKARKKNSYLISFAMLCLGVYLLISTGFSWIMLIVMILSVISSGVLSSFICAGGLLANFVSLYQIHDEASVYAYSQYNWIAVSFLSLSFVLLYQYIILSMPDRKFAQMIYQKGFYWGLICLLYLLLLISGSSKSAYRIVFPPFIYGDRIVECLNRVDLKMVGVIGLIFCILWIIRERILIHHDNKTFYNI